jgi:ankyrin repeat protein
MTVTNSKIYSSSKQLLKETEIGGNRDLNKVIELIREGADVNYQGEQDQETALMNASEQGDIEIMKVLLENGANVNLKSHSGNTALNYAVEPLRTMKGGPQQPESVKLLLKHRPNTNILNAFHIAIDIYWIFEGHSIVATQIVNLLQQYLRFNSKLMGSLVVQKGRTNEGKPLLSRAKRDLTTLICEFLGVGFIAESE